MRISDWSSDVCSSDLRDAFCAFFRRREHFGTVRHGNECRPVDRGVRLCRLLPADDRAGGAGDLDLLVDDAVGAGRSLDRHGGRGRDTRSVGTGGQSGHCPSALRGSEESRGGKEGVSTWRLGWSAENYKKKVKNI